MQKSLSFLLSLVVFPFFALANNLQISQVTVQNWNNPNGEIDLTFDLSWDNSWRTSSGPGNHDAVWLFAKYRLTSGTEWFHIPLTSSQTAPTGTQFLVPSDRLGAFIFRDADGSGTLSLTSVTLKWDASGVAFNEEIEVKVFGIEMVYVPQGAFYVGDGESTAGETFAHFEDGISGNPLQISSENALTLGGGTAGSLGNNNRTNQYAHPGCAGDGCLNGSGDDFDDTNSQTLPAAFPKGYEAFYCMKYEITQQQFADMLNTLSAAQQSVLLDSSNYFPDMQTARSRRYGISLSGTGWITSEPYVPIIYCDWIKTAAYADWAALRPMTELEFEKAARGPGTPLLREYPWGNAALDLSANLTLSNMGQANEGIATGYNGSGSMGNCWINDGVNHTMNTVARVGIFAANAANTGRVTAGASYYGIMELGGNAWERAVSVGHAEGRKFDGAHGDGYVDAAGYADVATWPGSFTSGAVNTNVGVGYRGGGMSWPPSNTPSNARISSRRLASGYWDVTIEDDGARLVRTAP